MLDLKRSNTNMDIMGGKNKEPLNFFPSYFTRTIWQKYSIFFYDALS